MKYGSVGISFLNRGHEIRPIPFLQAQGLMRPAFVATAVVAPMHVGLCAALFLGPSNQTALLPPQISPELARARLCCLRALIRVLSSLLFVRETHI